MTEEARLHAEAAAEYLAKIRYEIGEAERLVRKGVNAYRRDITDSFTEMNGYMDDMEYRLTGLLKFIERAGGAKR